MLYYIHDDNNKLIGFRYNGVTYYYQKNLQEDIIGILDSNYNIIVNYHYDAYGKILSITDNNGIEITDSNHIAYINSFRYRSYYYDNETKLYYLNSRYYNPNWGRFINADGILNSNIDILSYNLYTYCSNNPVNYDDENGAGFFKDIWKGIKKAGKTICDGISNLVGKIVNVKSNKFKTITKTNVGIDGVIDYEIGNSVTESKTIFGKDDAWFTININRNKNFFDSTVGISTNNKNINVSGEIGFGKGNVSVSMRKGDMVATHSFGNDKINMFYQFSLDIDSGVGVSDNVYAKGSLNSLVLVPVPIFSEIKNTIPAIGEFGRLAPAR